MANKLGQVLKIAEEHKRAIILAIIGIILSSWVMFNEQLFFTSAIMLIVFLFVSIFFYIIMPLIFKSKKEKSILFGIDQNFIGDGIIGLFVGGAFYLINNFGSVTGLAIIIGIPSVPLALPEAGKFLIICVVAPIAEELFFRSHLLGLFKTAILKDSNFSFHIANFIQAGCFMSFHYYAYGSSLLSMGGAFASAFIFGTLMGYLMLKTKSVLPGIVVHGMVNFPGIQNLS